MNRTITALYETRAQAERASEALKAAHLGDHVEIHDRSDADEGGQHDHRGVTEWLGGLIGGHNDKHVYEEGIRRGHFLLTAKVEERNETRAAQIIDAAKPFDIEDAQETWRADGWRAPASGEEAAEGAADADPELALMAVRVRVYNAL